MYSLKVFIAYHYLLKTTLYELHDCEHYYIYVYMYIVQIVCYYTYVFSICFFVVYVCKAYSDVVDIIENWSNMRDWEEYEREKLYIYTFRIF